VPQIDKLDQFLKHRYAQLQLHAKMAHQNQLAISSRIPMSAVDHMEALAIVNTLRAPTQVVNVVSPQVNLVLEMECQVLNT
jgi:hypothetical protein